MVECNGQRFNSSNDRYKLNEWNSSQKIEIQKYKSLVNFQSFILHTVRRNFANLFFYYFHTNIYICKLICIYIKFIERDVHVHLVSADI